MAKSVVKLAALALALLLFVGCASKPSGLSSGSMQATVSRADNLTQAEAEARAKILREVAYELNFDIDPTKPDFSAVASIRFSLAEGVAPETPVFLDFQGGQVKALTVNGRKAEESEVRTRQRSERIYFAAQDLKAGSNTVVVEFVRAFQNDGVGVQKSFDPVDNSHYIFTKLEPFEAHKVFPCFDQPDLKATYTLTTTVPKSWQMISNTRESQIVAKGDRRTWIFPRSAIFSTYLFSMHGGPYAVWTDKSSKIPSRLFARASLAEYVDHKEWFKITRDGIKFFEDYFRTPYPYGKMDQVIVPDFPSGGMENVASIMYNEVNIYRGTVTEYTRARRAYLIMHEIAHMWFGDLVTMKWWNGLWLNESFATYMGGLAVTRATKFKNPALMINSRTKQFAYEEDQLETTHPVEVPVPDTASSLTIFDSLTYGKGAASLQQLAFLIGEPAFRQGLASYFKKHANGNTDLADFMNAMSEASGKDLKAWQQAWLNTSGLNTVEAKWKCEQGRLKELNLHQGVATVGPLRMHRTRLQLIERNKSEGPTLDVSYEGPVTKVTLERSYECPRLILANADDMDYVKQKFSADLLPDIRDVISGSSAALNRKMLWSSLWESVRDGELPVQKYLDTVLEILPREDESQNTGFVMAQVVRAELNGDSAMKYLAPSIRPIYADKVRLMIEEQLNAAKGGSDMQMVWFYALLRAELKGDNVAFLRDLYTGRKKLPKLRIDQDKRWALVKAIARSGAHEGPIFIETELKVDPTDTGRKAAVAAWASMPEPKQKERWMDEIFKTKSRDGKVYPLPVLREAMMSYYMMGQERLLQPAAEKYFDTAVKMSANESERYISSLQIMFPGTCSEDIVKRSDKLLGRSGLHPLYIKRLKNGRQEEARCVRARAISAGTIQNEPAASGG